MSKRPTQAVLDQQWQDAAARRRDIVRLPVREKLERFFRLQQMTYGILVATGRTPHWKPWSWE